ncbi:hypothetical protein HYC85_004149 [Camellia sinensis]|uniref:Secreted protein n=1 Tax=Camellia sinensis TaxID=4442 RepID=A0A7J7HXT6_CAMSI|nr:hypothetical protein HYC85_004149 [Camellia sinensis]
MKGSCTLVASMLAASTVALTSSSSSSTSPDRDLSFNPCFIEMHSSSSSSLFSDKGGVSDSHLSSSGKDKFAPRFDGLRFIETLCSLIMVEESNFVYGPDYPPGVSVFPQEEETNE